MFVYFCVLSALSYVEMTPLNIEQHVGKNVTILCNWPSKNVKFNDKYLCVSPCTRNQHIILEAAFGKTACNNHINLTNSEDGLSVTFLNVQKSDSRRYYCGAAKYFFDSYIEVNLSVTDAESPSPETATATVNIGSTHLFAVTSGSILPTINHNMSTLNTIPSTKASPTSVTQGSGSVPFLPHLIEGVLVLIAILIVLLKTMTWMKKRQLKVDDAQKDGECEEMRLEDAAANQQTVISALCISADPNSLYANYAYHKDTKLAAESGNSKDFSLNSAFRSGVSSKGAYTDGRDTDSHCLYSVVQLPKMRTEPTGQSEPNQTEGNENDCIYSLAELPKPT